LIGSAGCPHPDDIPVPRRAASASSAPDRSESAPAAKPQPDGTLIRALARAWRWPRMLDEGIHTSVSEIGDAENISKSYVSRILRLALLAPDIVEGIVASKTDQGMMLEQLEPADASWEEQQFLALTRPHIKRQRRRAPQLLPG
jgi:hypothetical protein